MKKLLSILMLFSLLFPLALAATASPAESRNTDLAAAIQQQGEQCRTYMEEFGEDTNNQFIIQREATINQVEYELRKFKFTLAITILAAQTAALWLYHLIVKRKDRQYQEISVSFAKAAKERNKGVE